MNPNRRRVVAAACVVATAVASPVVSSVASATQPLHVHSGQGLHVRSVERIDRRQFNVSVATKALGRPVNVRVLLPVGYRSHPDRRYPTLYLYAGTGEHASDWSTQGKIESLVGRRGLIVVMPDVGFGAGDGWFSNWRDRTTKLGPNQWETFQVGELVPWIDANLRTRADRDGRAVAGLSQGGFGSMVAAVRHPDMFVSAAAFSGAVDIAYGGTVSPLGHAFVVGTTVVDGVEPYAVFGSPAHHETNWQGHDPTTLVRNLKGMDVWLFTGNGVPGPLDNPVTIPFASIEILAHLETLEMASHATATHVPVHLVDYGPGTHSWGYWQRDMRQYLPRLMRDFAAHRPAPHPVSYQATARVWSQWGWSVRIDRRVRDQFSYLRGATRRSFRLLGHGHAVVLTPRWFTAGTRVMTISRGPGGTSRQRATANDNGRLRLRVTLPVRVTIRP